MDLFETIDKYSNMAAEKEKESIKHSRAGNTAEAMQEIGLARDYRQLSSWLYELADYRHIIDFADQIIEKEYGALIPEGYADVFEQLKKIRTEGE